MRVRVIGTESLPESFLGKEGTVVGLFGDKLMVEFEASTEDTGYLRHTAYPRDLEQIKE